MFVDDEGDGPSIRHRLRDEAIAAPDLLVAEVISVIRRKVADESISTDLAKAAIDELLALPIELFPTRPFAWRVWELRNNVSAYDGCYVALAEALGCALLTGDRRLARAPTVRCAVEMP